MDINIKKENFIFSLLGSLGWIFFMLPIFLPIWSFSTEGTSKVFYALFDGLGNAESSFTANGAKLASGWAMAFTVIATIVLVMSVAYTIITIMQIYKYKNSKYDLIKKILAITTLIMGVIAIICAIVFTSGQFYELAGIRYGMKLEIGVWMFFIGVFLTGLFGYMASLNYGNSQDIKLDTNTSGITE